MTFASFVDRTLGPPATPAERTRAAMRLGRVGIIGAIACFVVGPLYLLASATVAGAVTIVTGVIFAGVTLLVRKRGPSHVTSALVLANAAGAVGVVVASAELGGITAPAIIWLPILVRASFVVLGVRAALPSVIITILAVVLLPFVTQEPIVSEGTLDVLRAASLVVALLSSFLAASAEEQAGRETVRLMEVANTAMQRARDEAEATSKLKSDFVANVTHELRTPLNAIVGMSGLLLDSELDDRQREHARTAKGAAESLVVLVDDLLESARLEAGRVALQPAPCDLRAIVESARDMLTLRARDKGLRIDLELPADIPRVVADAGRLRQVLTNLLDNAVKFTAQGHVTLRLALEEGEGNAVRARFDVEDTGIGVPAEKLDVIFERFRQADSSTTRSFGGTGLGLAITKDLLGLMGGSIRVRSTPGQGSTFTADVRLAKAAPVRSVEGTRVLLAEDNIVNQRIALYVLTSLGCHVDVAADGAEAVRLASERSYDVVLMDCHMPGMDGYKAAAAIRAQKGDALPIVALTAAGSDEDEARALAAGMNELLLKPIDVEGIRASLARVAPGTPLV